MNSRPDFTSGWPTHRRVRVEDILPNVVSDDNRRDIQDDDVSDTPHSHGAANCIPLTSVVMTGKTQRDWNILYMNRLLCIVIFLCAVFGGKFVVQWVLTYYG